MRGDLYEKISKFVSVVVMLNLAFGGFLGLMLIQDENTVKAPLPGPILGTITIASTYTVDGTGFENNTMQIDANILITTNGRLNLKNINLEFQNDIDNRHWLTVENGGILDLENSTITVKTSDMLENYEEVLWFNYDDGSGSVLKADYEIKRLIPFTITVTNANFYSSDDSSLKYEGELIIDQSEAIINDTVITSAGSTISDYDWGVVVQITDSTNVIFADSVIDKSPWYQGVWWSDPDSGLPLVQMYQNHSIINSNVYFINTYFDLDYRNKSTPHKWTNTNYNHFPKNVNPNHNALKITNSVVKFYGLTINMDEIDIKDDGSTAIEVLDAISAVTLYRWLAVYPVDSAGVPVEDASVNITTFWTGAFGATVNGLNDLVNNDAALQYLLRVNDAQLTWLPGNILNGITGKYGKVIVALASDMLTDTGWPNAEVVDPYEVEATKLSETTSISQDFENFPRVFPEDNFVTRIMPRFSFAAPHPELYPELINMPETSILEGLPVTIGIRIWNSIEAPPGGIADDVIVKVMDGDPTKGPFTVINETIITSIAIDDFETYWINWTATGIGAHTIFIAVDRDYEDEFNNNLIPEINEDNNTISTKITVLERSDLSVTSADISFNPSSSIVNGTGITIRAVVHNTGGSTASKVNVTFYLGTISTPTQVIGYDEIQSISPNGGVGYASKGYGPTYDFEGPHYIWVVIDEADDITEKNENNNSAYNILWVKKRPDLNPSLVPDPSSPRKDGTTITLEAQVANNGEWNVTVPVEVKFYLDDPNDEDNLLGESTIPVVAGVSVPFNDTVSTSIEWVATPPGAYTIWVVVDPDNDVFEGDETNNRDSVQFVVEPKPNLAIESGDVVVDPDAYPMNATDLNINITIHNNGQSDVTSTFYVKVWLDETTGSHLLQEWTITGGITMGNSLQRDFDWLTVTPPGMHELIVWVDYNNSVGETSESDNMVKIPIIVFEVPSDLIVNNTFYGTLVLDDYWEPSDPYIRDGFTLVEEQGVLIIRNTIFEVKNQQSDDEFNIVVRDDGVLIIEDDSSITSDGYHVYLYLFDNATVYINASIIDNVIDIIAMDNAKIYINYGSSIQGEIFANASAPNVYINATNSSFSQDLDHIADNTFVELWGVYIGGSPADDGHITVKDDAKVEINWFLMIDTVDNNNAPIDGANVSFHRSPPWIETDKTRTNSIGRAYFWLRGMDITSEGVVKDIGSYKIKAYFDSPITGLTYYPDMNVSVEMTQNKVKTIKFSSVMPDLDPPMSVDPNPTNVGSPTTITAYVNNTGPGAALGVRVEFRNNRTDEPGWPKVHIKDLLAGESWMITFVWNPVKQGYHNISIWVDPTKLIIEEDENNNWNWIDPVDVKPQLADLNVTSGDIYFTTTNPYGPTENDTVTIHASISNNGDTDADNVVVEYWKDFIGGTLLGYGNVSKVRAGDSEESKFKWESTTPPGLYTIWISVDRFDTIDETIEVVNNQASKTYDIKTYPDITPVGIDFSESPVTDETEVTITAYVNNDGETDAPNVVVQFFDGDPSNNIQIGTSQKIALIEAGDSGEASVVWTSTVVGLSELHTIYAVASGVDETVEDNNERTATILVTLRPELSVDSISFSDQSPYEGESLTITATINNSGGTDSTQFYVGFYDGPPVSGDQIGTYQPLTLTIGESDTVQVPWASPTGGSHDIYVVADAQGQIKEPDENNNELTEVIVVYSDEDIIVNNTLPSSSPGDLVINPGSGSFNHRGFILIEEDGVLTITQTLFTVSEGSDYDYNIIIRDDGVLIIEDGSVLLTNGKLMRIYLYDNAKFYVNDSQIKSFIFEIKAYNNAEIYIDESTIGSNLMIAESSPDVRLYATNSSLNAPFTNFGGTSIAVFKDVYTPSVDVSDSAELHVYQWLKVYVKDGADLGLPESRVWVWDYIDKIEIDSSYQDTNSEGLAIFDVLTDIFTSTGVILPPLNYEIYAEHEYGPTTYSGNSSVEFTSYVFEKDDNIEEVDVIISDLKPDLTVDGNDIIISRDAETRDVVGVGEPITVSVTVYNVGMAGTNQTVVRFYHDISPLLVYEASEMIGETTITDYIAAETGVGTASIAWVPQTSDVGEDERIVAVLDPNNIIDEITEGTDNEGYNVLDIRPPPDLSVVSVRFNTPGFQNVDNTTEGETVTIRVKIRNKEDTNPAQFINVTVYDENPIYGGELIGFFDMGSSELIPDRERTVDIKWDTSGESIGDHFVYVLVEDHTTIGQYEIPDQNLEDNELIASLYIHTKPDMRPMVLPQHTDIITVFRNDGSRVTNGRIQIGQALTVMSTIYNDGKVYIPAVNVSFWNGDPEEDGTLIGGGNVTIQLTPNDYQNATVQWSVNAAVGPVEIYVWVNRYGEAPESDATNNKEFTEFEVELAPIVLSFTGDGPDSKYKTGETITVDFRVNYTGSETGVENLPYTLTIFNVLNEPMYTTTGNLNILGSMHEEIAAPDTGGDYYINVEVTYGGGTYSERADFSVEEPPSEFLPWWMLVIILVSAILAVLAVGIFLARFGLGRLVECGECGAFIPEGEKKCPKCGAVFETDTAKCSECGAWIPVDSKSCPECGAMFAGIEKEKKDYIERMKLQYAEYVDQFRDEAKEDLGEAMTDEMFLEWWKASPKYVGFENWLEREEELRKGKTYPCPDCGTINPISATICFKCGTVFKKEGEEEEFPEIEEPPATPPAEVPAKVIPKEVRQPPAQRPVERKAAAPPTVVPKKVVQAPPTVVPKKVVKPPEGRPPTVVPKKVVKRPVEEEK